MEFTSVSVMNRDFAYRCQKARDCSNILWSKRSKSRTPVFDRGNYTHDSIPVGSNGKC